MVPRARVFRYVIENTEYLDWYYGLHHLFESGVRPSTVVLCLNLSHTVSSITLGDYSARHLFGVSELLPVAHDAGMSPTQISGLVLAHWSAFYASRATIRNFILNKTDPPYATALHQLADTPKRSVPADEELVAKARLHLSAMQQLCARYGVQFVLLIPPSLGRGNDLLASAADAEHISFYYPLQTGSLGPEYFRPDRTHLNEKGAVVFTAAIARAYRPEFRRRGNKVTSRVMVPGSCLAALWRSGKSESAQLAVHSEPPAALLRPRTQNCIRAGHHVLGYSHIVGPAGDVHPLHTLVRPLNDLEAAKPMIQGLCDDPAFPELGALGPHTCKSFYQGVQLICRNHELSKTAIETNSNLWKQPDSRLIQTFTAREMDVHLRTERALVV